MVVWGWGALKSVNDEGSGGCKTISDAALWVDWYMRLVVQKMSLLVLFFTRFFFFFISVVAYIYM